MGLATTFDAGFADAFGAAAGAAGAGPRCGVAAEAGATRGAFEPAAEAEGTAVFRGAGGVACVVAELGIAVPGDFAGAGASTGVAAAGSPGDSGAPSVVRRVRVAVGAGAGGFFCAGGFCALPDPPRLCAGFGSEIENTCDGAFACVTGIVVIVTRGANGFPCFLGGGAGVDADAGEGGEAGAASPSAGFCGSGGAGLFGSEDTRIASCANSSACYDLLTEITQLIQLAQLTSPAVSSA